MMYRADSAFLVSKSYQPNSFGAMVPSEETTREIPVEVRSISRSEWTAAGQNGFNPAYVFVTPEANYSGEEIIIFHGDRYSIYRTYIAADSDLIELYAEKKAGDRHG